MDNSQLKKGDALSLPKGYKNTEMGLIPEDWKVKKLSEIGKFSKGSGVRKDEALSGNIPCVRYGELYTKHSDYIKQFYSYISKDISINAKRLKKGDILFAGSGETKEEIGKCVAFVNEFEAYAGGDIVILTPDNANSLYLGYLLNAPFIQKQKASRGQGDAVVHISSAQLGNILIPLPKEDTEQTAIANALSDADALINSLKKLIAKKRNIKQGAMQKLLQLNPDSYREGWKVKKLGEICEIFGRIGFRGYTKKDIVGKEQGAITISPSNLQDDKMDFSECVYISWFKYEESPEIKIFNDDILLVKTGSTSGKTALVKNLNEKATINPQIVVLKKILVDNVFLSYIMSNRIVQNQIKTTIVGGAIPTLSQKQIANFEISIPPPEEQTRIATILSVMDEEIQALETKLEKYRKIKLGIMQNLLTGKIRLV